jgi:hypothetical protein
MVLEIDCHSLPFVWPNCWKYEGSRSKIGLDLLSYTCPTLPALRRFQTLAIEITQVAASPLLSLNVQCVALTMTTTLKLNSTTENRFSPITDEDRAGILWIASLLAGVYSILSILVRFYIKRKCFGTDDWLCAAATVDLPRSPHSLLTSQQIFGTGSFVANCIGLSYGLGKMLSLVDATHLQDISDVGSGSLSLLYSANSFWGSSLSLQVVLH